MLIIIIYPNNRTLIGNIKLLFSSNIPEYSVVLLVHRFLRFANVTYILPLHIKNWANQIALFPITWSEVHLHLFNTVSYTHLTLPTIYSV